MNSLAHHGPVTQGWRRFGGACVLALGVLALALLVWLPRTQDSQPERASIPVQPAVHQPAGVPAREELDPARPRARQLLQMLEWIPGGFPVALALDLGALRKHAWTRAFAFLVESPAFRRHLDVLQLDADGFELLGLGLDPVRPPISWSGRSLHFSFVPHVFLLRGREGRMDLLRRFWQSRQGGAPLQVGQYQLVFPLRHEPHMVVGAWRADLAATVGLLERTQNPQSICQATRCRDHFEKLQSSPHLLGILSPRTPVRLSAGVQIRSILVMGEWNPDGLLLQAVFELAGPCPEAAARIKELVTKNLNAWKLDDVFFRRTHFGCGSGTALHVTLPLSVHEIQKQLILFGMRH